MPQRLIGSYFVRVSSGPTGASGVRARIRLLDPDNVPNGTILFYEQGQTMPPSPPGGTTLHLPASMMSVVMDLLRNEKPLSISSDRLGAFLSTSPEPQGEGE